MKSAGLSSVVLFALAGLSSAHPQGKERVILVRPKDADMHIQALEMSRELYGPVGLLSLRHR